MSTADNVQVMLWDRALTDEELLELTQVLDATTQTERPVSNALVWFFTKVAKANGHDTIEQLGLAQGGTFDPVLCRIPSDQRELIGKMLMATEQRLTADDHAGLSELLEWMNRGPSGS